MNTYKVSFVLRTLVVVLLTLAQSVLADLPSCYNKRYAGGAIVVVTVSTNSATGTSIVLPVRVKMCPEVEANIFWNMPLYFGSNVTVLPPQTVAVSPGYLSVYVTNYHTAYSSDYPIYIQSTLNGTDWTNEFYFTMYGATSEVDGSASPCSTPRDIDYFGSINSNLYPGSNTNGLDMWTGGMHVTNSILKRFGLGACRTDNDDAVSRGTVSFIFYNLPPKSYSRFYEGQVLPCQPGTNYFERMWFVGCDTNTFMPYCGYDVNYGANFLMNFFNNVDCTQNWPYTNAPCPPTNPLKTYRVYYGGSPCCNETACSSFDPYLFISRSSTNRVALAFQMEFGFRYQILTKNTLTDLSWNPWTPEVSGSGWITNYDTPNLPSRIYRLGRTVSP